MSNELTRRSDANAARSSVVGCSSDMTVKVWVLGVAGRDQPGGVRPADAEGRIVPADPSCALRMVCARHLVQDLAVRFESEEPVGHSRRDEEGVSGAGRLFSR